MSELRYINQKAIRNRACTKTLEQKLVTAVDKVFGKNYSIRIYSGGQARKGTKGPRTGSTRHDDLGQGGRAADVYIYGPDGKKLTKAADLDRLWNFWLKNEFGSCGVYMQGMGMHLDEITKDKLARGQGLFWIY